MIVEDLGKGNKINFSSKFEGVGSLKIFGNNNNIYIGKMKGLLDLQIYGNNSALEVKSLSRCGRLRAILKNSGVLFIDEATTIEDCYILADGKKVHIGKDCMISFQVDIRTTDAHGIYDISTGDILNANEDIFIDDHVWLAQGVMVAKGSHIGKNSIIGAKSYLSKLKVEPNILMAGTPPRLLKKDVIWDRRMTENIYAENANIDPRLFSYLG